MTAPDDCSQDQEVKRDMEKHDELEADDKSPGKRAQDSNKPDDCGKSCCPDELLIPHPLNLVKSFIHKSTLQA